jgi:hypothetical protein
MKRRMLKGLLVLGAIVVVTICDAAGLLTRGPERWQPEPALTPDQPNGSDPNQTPAPALNEAPGAIQTDLDPGSTASQRSPR